MPHSLIPYNNGSHKWDSTFTWEEWVWYYWMKCNSLITIPFILTKQNTPKRCFFIIFISFFYFLPNRFLGLRFWIKWFICYIKDEFKSFKLDIEV